MYRYDQVPSLAPLPGYVQPHGSIWIIDDEVLLQVLPALGYNLLWHTIRWSPYHCEPRALDVRSMPAFVVVRVLPDASFFTSSPHGLVSCHVALRTTCPATPAFTSPGGHDLVPHQSLCILHTQRAGQGRSWCRTKCFSCGLCIGQHSRAMHCGRAPAGSPWGKHRQFALT